MLTETKLRDKLIQTISTTHDTGLLYQLSRIVDFEENINDLYEMSPAEEMAVRDGQEQLRRGEYVSHEEANKQVAAWLKK